MSTRILILLMVSVGALLFRGSPRSHKQGDITTVKNTNSEKETSHPGHLRQVRVRTQGLKRRLPFRIPKPSPTTEPQGRH